MAVIRSFRELDVYRLALQESRRIFDRTKEFPKEEMYSLTNQIRRSSRAVCAMIAEAWARRRYRAVFVSKMDEALGEATETQAWLDQARECDYIDYDEHQDLNNAGQHVGAMLRRVVDRADDFCAAANQ